MGITRALSVVALQELLMTGVRDYRDDVSGTELCARALATAASLDYVLMLATDTARTPIPADQTRAAIHAGFARAADDALALLRAIVGIDNPSARAFVRDGLRTVQAAVSAEALATNDRMFAMIALVQDLDAR